MEAVKSAVIRLLEEEQRQNTEPEYFDVNTFYPTITLYERFLKPRLNELRSALKNYQGSTAELESMLASLSAESSSLENFAAVNPSDSEELSATFILAVVINGELETLLNLCRWDEALTAVNTWSTFSVFGHSLMKELDVGLAKAWIAETRADLGENQEAACNKFARLCLDRGVEHLHEACPANTPTVITAMTYLLRGLGVQPKDMSLQAAIYIQIIVASFVSAQIDNIPELARKVVALIEQGVVLKPKELTTFYSAAAFGRAARDDFNGARCFLAQAAKAHEALNDNAGMIEFTRVKQAIEDAEIGWEKCGKAGSLLKDQGNVHLNHARGAKSEDERVEGLNKAVQCYSTALESVPDSTLLYAQLLTNRAFVQQLLGEPKIALESALRAIQGYPSYVKAYYRGAQCALKANSPTMARTLIQRAVSTFQTLGTDTETAKCFQTLWEALPEEERVIGRREAMKLWARGVPSEYSAAWTKKTTNGKAQQSQQKSTTTKASNAAHDLALAAAIRRGLLQAPPPASTNSTPTTAAAPAIGKGKKKKKGGGDAAATASQPQTPTSVDGLTAATHFVQNVPDTIDSVQRVKTFYSKELNSKPAEKKVFDKKIASVVDILTTFEKDHATSNNASNMEGNDAVGSLFHALGGVVGCSVAKPSPAQSLTVDQQALKKALTAHNTRLNEVEAQLLKDQRRRDEEGKQLAAFNKTLETLEHRSEELDNAIAEADAAKAATDNGSVVDPSLDEKLKQVASVRSEIAEKESASAEKMAELAAAKEKKLARLAELKERLRSSQQAQVEKLKEMAEEQRYFENMIAKTEDVARTRMVKLAQSELQHHCDICGESFRRKLQMVTHRKKHPEAMESSAAKHQQQLQSVAHRIIDDVAVAAATAAPPAATTSPSLSATTVPVPRSQAAAQQQMSGGTSGGGGTSPSGAHPLPPPPPPSYQFATGVGRQISPPFVPAAPPTETPPLLSVDPAASTTSSTGFTVTQHDAGGPAGLAAAFGGGNVGGGGGTDAGVSPGSGYKLVADAKPFTPGAMQGSPWLAPPPPPPPSGKSPQFNAGAAPVLDIGARPFLPPPQHPQQQPTAAPASQPNNNVAGARLVRPQATMFFRCGEVNAKEWQQALPRIQSDPMCQMVEFEVNKRRFGFLGDLTVAASTIDLVENITGVLQRYAPSVNLSNEIRTEGSDGDVVVKVCNPTSAAVAGLQPLVSQQAPSQPPQVQQAPQPPSRVPLMQPQQSPSSGGGGGGMFTTEVFGAPLGTGADAGWGFTQSLSNDLDFSAVAPDSTPMMGGAGGGGGAGGTSSTAGLIGGGGGGVGMIGGPSGGGGGVGMIGGPSGGGDADDTAWIDSLLEDVRSS